MKRKQASGSLCAGVAKVDITNEAKDVIVSDPLYAKALVLDDGETKAAIITMDTTAIGGRKIARGFLNDVGEEFLPQLRDRMKQAFEIPGCNVMVNASHTHPAVSKLLCDDEDQLDKVFGAVGRAMQTMTPAKIGMGAGREDRISINRTLTLKNGRHWTSRNTYPSPPDADIASLGPIDPEIGIIRVDRLDGTPLAVVYNFACHPLFGEPLAKITADFPGVASRVIEESLGHDAMALFLQGAGGDVSDVWLNNFERPRDVEPLGTMLALSTLKGYREIKPQDVKLKVLSETVRLPYRTDISDRIAELRAEQSQQMDTLKWTGFNFKTFIPMYIQYGLNPDRPLDYGFNYMHQEMIGGKGYKDMDTWNRDQLDNYVHNIHVMENLAKIHDDILTHQKHQEVIDESGEDAIDAEIQGIRIGDGVLITSPAEMLVEVGLNVKKASLYKHTFMAGCTNGYLHYGPPASYYDRGGYEVTECLLDAKWQQIYEEKANEIISKL